jgi:hypothetical protein
MHVNKLPATALLLKITANRMGASDVYYSFMWSGHGIIEKYPHALVQTELLCPDVLQYSFVVNNGSNQIRTRVTARTDTTIRYRTTRS